MCALHFLNNFEINRHGYLNVTVYKYMLNTKYSKKFQKMFNDKMLQNNNNVSITIQLFTSDIK